MENILNFDDIYNFTVTEYSNLLYSVIGFKNVAKHVPAKIPFFYLYNYGAFVEYEDDIFRFTVSSPIKDIYGENNTFRLFALNGTSFTVKRESVKRLTATYNGKPLKEICHEYALRFAIVEKKLFDNIINSCRAQIIETNDENNVKRLKQLDKLEASGKVRIYSTTGIGGVSKTLDYSAEFRATELQFLKSQIRNDFLSKIGIHTSNYDKKERIQSVEVSAFASESIDNINSIVECFNRDAEQQGSKIRMFINTTAIELLDYELEQNNDNVPRETGDNNE